MAESIPLFYRALLRHPERVLWHVDKLYEAGRIDKKPNLWQVSMGVFYMVHRILFRSETIGVDESPVRSTIGARLLRYRPLRFPFLLLTGSVDPIDLTGLAGTVEQKLTHLVGAYHPGDNALYDLECIAFDQEAIRKLQKDVESIVAEKTLRGRFLKDLTVYEGYHERLLSLVERALRNDYAPAADHVDHPDTTLRGFVRWCAAQEETPEKTLEALRQGRLRFGPEAG
jgi:hypothetical protein